MKNKYTPLNTNTAFATFCDILCPCEWNREEEEEEEEDKKKPFFLIYKSKYNPLPLFAVTRWLIPSAYSVVIYLRKNTNSKKKLQIEE